MRQITALRILAILAAFASMHWCGEARASGELELDPAPITVGLHLYSAHLWPSQGYQNVTPGLYAEHRGWVAGGYSNSEGGGSVYAGHMWRSVFGSPLDVMIGAVTGYRRAPVLPMLVPSIRLPFGLRLSYVPAPGKDASLHLSIETTIER